MTDIILERSAKEMCPICNKNMSSVKIKVAKYKDTEVFICEPHYVQPERVK